MKAAKVFVSFSLIIRCPYCGSYEEDHFMLESIIINKSNDADSCVAICGNCEKFFLMRSLVRRMNIDDSQ